ncbi:unnamed protein product [Polarella glacialis]|uniref:Uncharacterized protein n=1 Tax=Polarella glacialis TaxID=89957 RepID=A0A813LAS2_POLGL|nr:unnamed protein product [Polarella glacialis]
MGCSPSKTAAEEPSATTLLQTTQGGAEVKPAAPADSAAPVEAAASVEPAAPAETTEVVKAEEQKTEAEQKQTAELKLNTAEVKQETAVEVTKQDEPESLRLKALRRLLEEPQVEEPQVEESFLLTAFGC